MLNGLPITNLTASALLGIAILLLLFGRLVPRSTMNDKIVEANNWREAYEAERDARATSDAQTVELLELAKTTNKIVEALFNTTERFQQTGGSHVVPTKK